MFYVMLSDMCLSAAVKKYERMFDQTRARHAAWPFPLNTSFGNIFIIIGYLLAGFGIE